MPSKSLENHRKAQAERLQGILHDLLMEEENKYCADCDAKQPRWAAWNLGVFVCIRCAGIHRSIGVQVSRVKSVNLDSWTPEQVQSMRVMGNAKAKAVYEAELPRDYRRPQTEQQLEIFIRAKYEHKRYLLRDWEPPKVDVVDLLPALEKGQHRNSFKKPNSEKSVDSGLQLPSLPSPNQSSPQGHSSLTPAVKDMQLLDLSDTTPTSSLNPVVQKPANSASLSFFNDDGSAGEVSLRLNGLLLDDKPDGLLEDELEDMFGPIVSAPRMESLSEPPDGTSGNLGGSYSSTSQQSASVTDLGDLASLTTTSSTGGKKTNADILALFGSETPARTVASSQGISQFPQNAYDNSVSGVATPRAPWFHPVFPPSNVPSGSVIPPRDQQQFPIVSNGLVPSVGGMTAKETFALFAAASPFATANGPASSNFMTASSDLLGSSGLHSAFVSSSLTSNSAGTMNIGINLDVMSTTNSTNVVSGVAGHNSMEPWPFGSSGLIPQNLPPQANSAQVSGAIKKDPLASLGFDQFCSASNGGGARIEAATAQDISLWD